MKRLKQYIPAICYGVVACGELILYITTCGWQPRELLTVLTILFAAFDCGLCLSRLIKW